MFRCISILCFLILVSSCTKDKYVQGDGHASALKNGEEWEAVAWTSYKTRGYSEDTIEFYFNTYTKEGYDRDGLSFFAIPLNIGEVELFTKEFTRTISSASLILSYEIGDVIGDRYDVIEGHPLNHFELTEISTKTGKIAGLFEVAMFIDTSKGQKKDPTVPDTVLFTDGKFELYMEELRN